MRIHPLLILLLAAGSAVPAQAEQVAGPVITIDGDSLAMTGVDIRLFGIDSPESRQSCVRGGISWNCGGEAAEALRALTGGKDVSCLVKDHDVYGRSVATCKVGRMDLALALLQAGMTTALPGADPEYRDAEEAARRRGAGLWAGPFENPAAWRAAHPRPSTQATKNEIPERRASTASRIAAVGCAIKGNRSRRMGEAIYYLPGMRYYAETRPEAMFCNEREAMAAGYRRSRAG